jgi:hypothetical protein
MKKILHILFIAFFLLYAVTPIWYHIGESDDGSEIGVETLPAVESAPSLLIGRLLSQILQQDKSDGTGLGRDKAGSGMLLRKKRAVLSSKKSLTPLLATETSADANDFGSDRRSWISVTPEIATKLHSYFHHHSGSSPPLS